MSKAAAIYAADGDGENTGANGIDGSHLWWRAGHD